MAIAFTETEFRFAVNGFDFGLFTYRSKNQLNLLNGLKIVGSYGLNVEVTGVDHLETGFVECDGFETYSHPDIPLL